LYTSNSIPFFESILSKFLTKPADFADGEVELDRSHATGHGVQQRHVPCDDQQEWPDQAYTSGSVFEDYLSRYQRYEAEGSLSDLLMLLRGLSQRLA
jgi:hypothetical protein